MKAFVGLTASLFLIFTLLFLFAESRGWTEEAYLTARIEAIQRTPGGTAAAGAVIGLLLAFDLILPVPSSVLMTLSGAVLGWHVGWMVSFAGAMGSALLGFGLCRTWGRPAFERLIGAAESRLVERFFERYGVWAVLLSRSVPMLTEVVSCLAGLSRLRFSLFALLALAGTGPLCVVYAWAGARGAAQGGWDWALGLAFLLPALGFGLMRALRAVR